MFEKNTRVLVEVNGRRQNGIFLKETSKNLALVEVANAKYEIATSKIQPIPTFSEEQFRRMSADKIKPVINSNIDTSKMMEEVVDEKEDENIEHNIKQNIAIQKTENILQASSKDSDLSGLLNDIEILEESYKHIPEVARTLNLTKKSLEAFKKENVLEIDTPEYKYTKLLHLKEIIVYNKKTKQEITFPTELFKNI